ncbi:MAG: hypothetical protein AB1393_01190 [Candidatus Edwardsbacteria bacterium]
MNLVFQVIFTIMGAFLSVALTVIFVQNGRQIKQLGTEMKHLGERMDEGFKKMDNTLTKISELIVAENNKFAELVVSEERNTRALIESCLKGKKYGRESIK